jgi:hypothetical protein
MASASKGEAAKIDRLGVAAVEKFFSSHGWLFREQLFHDYGVDAQVEVVIDGRPTGSLIAIQIKAGESYFSEESKDAFLLRSDDKHVNYWSKHALPVILIIYHPKQDALFWESLSEQTVQTTGKGWKVHIPKKKALTKESLKELSALTQPPSYIQKLNRLRLDRPWMELVAEGEVVYVQFGDWVNKSRPRFTFRIGCDSRSDVEPREWPTIWGGGRDLQELLSVIFPWADYEVDEEAYRADQEVIWSAECYGWTDDETGEVYYTEPFSDYYSPPPEGLVPVSNDGEVAHYRIILSLNDFGKSFITVDDCLSEDDSFPHGDFISRPA